jgi:putative DNA primase/helicase
MPVFALGKTLYENEVRLGAAVISGKPLWSIDNLRVPLEGEQLCQVIERPVPMVRVLGKSELVAAANAYCSYATGNNLRIHEDAIRRVVSARLDARMEFPEDRVFAFDPVQRILEDRGRYIRAALLVIRAFLENGATAVAPLASFEDWSNTVRSALVWLGHADPLESMREQRFEDPRRVMFASLIAAWPFPVVKLSEIPGIVTGNTAGDLCTKAMEMDPQAEDGLRYRELYDVLLSIASKPRGLGLDTTVLGNWLADHRGWEVDSKRLERIPGKRPAHWIVTKP